MKIANVHVLKSSLYTSHAEIGLGVQLGYVSRGHSKRASAVVDRKSKPLIHLNSASAVVDRKSKPLIHLNIRVINLHR
jgi:hypothetical protein